MKLEKAIELAKETTQSLHRGKFYDHEAAIKLLIEAGKRVQLQRNPDGCTTEVLLPGESED